MRRAYITRCILETNQLPTSLLYFDQISQLTYDLYNNLMPENIVSMFQEVTHTHRYRTRSATNQNFNNNV